VDPTRPIGADALVEALRGVVGAEHVLVEPDLRVPYEVDWTGRFRGTARCVVRPATTEQVACVLRACARNHAPVVPQGGNTGLVGGSVPRGGEVVLSMRRLDDIGDVDDDHGEVVAGAGAPLAVVRDAARAAAWDVGVDLASRESATIGGMVATNAGRAGSGSRREQTAAGFATHDRSGSRPLSSSMTRARTSGSTLACTGAPGLVTITPAPNAKPKRPSAPGVGRFCRDPALR